MNTRTTAILTCAALALAVVLGAFGAHALEDQLTQSQKHTWETASAYHFYHGLGALILLMFAMRKPGKFFAWAIRLHLLGILLFSGSLYLLAAQEVIGLSLSWLGPVTPLGGLAFIAGWLMALAGFTQKE